MRNFKLLHLFLLLCGAFSSGSVFSQVFHPKGTKLEALCVITNANLPSAVDQVLVATLQGLVAKTSSEQIYINEGGPGENWLNDLHSNHGIALTPYASWTTLLSHFQGKVTGYILYDKAGNNRSVTAATSLCGPLNAIAVDVSQEATVRALGITTLQADVRGKDEKWVYQNYPDLFNKQMAAELNPDINGHLRDYITLTNSFALAWLALPYFNALSSKTLTFPWGEWWLVPMLAGATVFMGVLAGLYPSFYLSSFRPIEVLKGNLSQGSKSSTMRSALVVFQFTTSIILIVGTFIIQRQMGYILHKKVGFDKDQVLLLYGTNTLGEGLKSLKNELLRLPEVKAASISDYLPIKGTKRNGDPVWKEGKSKEESPVGAQKWQVDHDYLKTLGIKLVAGRDFSTQMASDSQAVIINQTMVRKLGLKNPVGVRITNGQLWTVIGVVEDFHYESLRDSIQPIYLTLGNSPSILSVKVKTANMGTLLTSVNQVWKEFAPNQPIRYSFLDENFARMYEDVQRTGRIFTSFAILAIVVACLGLYGLSSFMVEQRTKEISIRRVLGASVKSIFNLLTLSFVKLVLLSFAIAVPIGWYWMHQWLEDFVYRTPISPWLFLLAGMTALLIALLTISYQSLRAALTKPVQGLRSE